MSGRDRKLPQLRPLLICHRGVSLHEDSLARWLAANTDLCGILLINESRGTFVRRVRSQIRRTGLLRFLDVIAFRLYYRLHLRRSDAQYEQSIRERISAMYPSVGPSIPRLIVKSPNSAEAQAFVQECAPNITLAVCKSLLKRTVFSVPSHGTFVLHPGICPEYRNAHGCFWALARRDLANVGMSVLRIDDGIDTGPVYGYFRSPFDESRESHVRIQHRMTFDNLEGILDLLHRIVHGQVNPIPTEGRTSATWGQPWLSSYVRWKRAALRAREIP